MSQLLAKTAKKVIAIDNSPKMVEFGAKLAARARFQESRIPARRHRRSADREKLGRSRDFEPGVASRDSSGTRHRRRYRILKKGGRLVVLDLLSHRFERARELYADHWLGFSGSAVAHQWLEGGRFQKNRSHGCLARKREPAFSDGVCDWCEVARHFRRRSFSLEFYLVTAAHSSRRTFVHSFWSAPQVSGYRSRAPISSSRSRMS